mgnify:CR=1 FL=1
MAANYSVNINLDTKKARDAIDVLEKRVNRLRRSLNKPIAIESKAVMLQKQQLQLQDRKFATMKITRRLGEQVRKHEEQGLKLDRLRLELKNAARHTDKGRLETARSANKFVADELRNLEKQVQTNAKNAGIDKDRVRTLSKLIGLKRTEAGLNRLSGKVAVRIDSANVGPRALPSTEMLKAEQKGIKILDPNNLGRLNTSQATKDRTTALSFEKKIEDIKKRSLDKTLGLRNNQKLLNHLSEAGLNIQRKNFNLVKQELGQAELLIAAAKKQAAAQKEFDEIDKARAKDREKLLKGAPVKFKAFDDRYGPQMAPPGLTKGAGQVAMSIDTITKQSEKRLGIEMKLRELEAKGVKTTKIRAKMGELVDAQNKKQFGTIKKLNREIGRMITKEEGKLKILRLQNKERMEANRMTVKESAAQGPFSRLSDRQSRDAQGKRTFMNNPFVGGLARSLPQGMQPTRGFDFGSAMISGGFPLLFGQGPVTAAAGALGGGIGGMFGQMGGFAGGIAATAVVQSLTNIMNGVRELGKSLTTLDGQFTLLSEKSLFSSKQTEARAKVLQALGEREKLATLLSEELTAVLGEGGAEKLRRAGEASKELDKTVAELTINLQLLLAGPLTKFLEMVNDTLDQGKSVSLGKGKGDVRFGGKEETFVEEFGEVLKLLSQGQLDRIFKAANDLQINPGDVAARAVLQSEGLNNLSNPELQALRKFSLVKQVNPESKLVGGEGPDKDDPANKIVEIDAQRVANAQKKINAMQKEMEFAESILEVGYEEAELQREIQSITEGLNEEELKLLETGELTVEQLIKKNREAKNLVDNARLVSESFEQLKDTIVVDIGNGIKDLIKGTASLNDVLTGVLDKMTDAFLNLAIFGNFAGGSVTGGLLGMFKANGGPVKGGRSYIVGERGPEVFTPGVSGGITPNHALGGSTNVSVNVDASGSSVEGDAGQAEQLGEAISQAIQAELIQQKRPGGILYN